jgi:hypothetical protein
MNDESPAFPTWSVVDIKKGMTLRDYFAASAMQGILAAKAWHPDYVFPNDFEFSAGKKADFSLAQAAYKYADAIIKERK